MTMSDKKIQYCPFCGLEVTDTGMQEWECDGCGDMYMEIWGYTPEFWHRE